MKIGANDLTDNRSELFDMLESNAEDGREYMRLAERYFEVNRMLIYNIQEGRITDTEQVRKAIDLMEYTVETPVEIIDHVLKMEV